MTTSTTLTIDKTRNLRVSLIRSVCGSLSDPYSVETVRITLPHGTSAELVLGPFVTGVKVTMYDRNELVRSEEIHTRSALWEIKINLLAKRLTGISFAEAYERIDEHLRKQRERDEWRDLDPV